MLYCSPTLSIGNKISDELQKLADEGFGRYIDKTEMESDKILEQCKCFSAFVKNDIQDMEPHFFRGLNENDCSPEVYEAKYIEPMDIVMKKVAIHYHTNRDLLVISPELDPTDSKYICYIVSLQYKYSIRFVAFSLFKNQITKFKEYSMRIFLKSIPYESATRVFHMCVLHMFHI